MRQLTKSVVKIDRKNQADSLAYQAEKQLSDLGDKVPAADKTKVEGWSKTCGLAKDDDERIKTLMPELQQALFAVGSNLYQQGGGDTAAEAPAQMIDSTSSASGSDDVMTLISLRRSRRRLS